MRSVAERSVVIALKRIPVKGSACLRIQPSFEPVGEATYTYLGGVFPWSGPQPRGRRKRIDDARAQYEECASPVQANASGVDQSRGENVGFFQSRKLPICVMAFAQIVEVIRESESSIVIHV